MLSVTIPYALVIGTSATITLITLATAAFTVQRCSARRSLDLSPPSPRTPRSCCPRPWCRLVHPGNGRHRRDPRPDGAVDVFASALFCGFGLISVPKGAHYGH